MIDRDKVSGVVQVAAVVVFASIAGLFAGKGDMPGQEGWLWGAALFLSSAILLGGMVVKELFAYITAIRIQEEEQKARANRSTNRLGL